MYSHIDISCRFRVTWNQANYKDFHIWHYLTIVVDTQHVGLMNREHREYFFNSDDTIEMISSLISLMKPFSDFLHVFKETRTSFPAPAVPFAQLGPSPFTLISYLQSHLWSYSPVYIHCFHFRVFAICCLLCLYFHPQIFT